MHKNQRSIHFVFITDPLSATGIQVASRVPILPRTRASEVSRTEYLVLLVFPGCVAICHGQRFAISGTKQNNRCIKRMRLERVFVNRVSIIIYDRYWLEKETNRIRRKKETHVPGMRSISDDARWFLHVFEEAMLITIAGIIKAACMLLRIYRSTD